jgi:hypothetical protein
VPWTISPEGRTRNVKRRKTTDRRGAWGGRGGNKREKKRETRHKVLQQIVRAEISCSLNRQSRVLKVVPVPVKYDPLHRTVTVKYVAKTKRGID